MKAIVIGSKGFIGGHVVANLRRSGWDVYGCDVVVEYNDPMYFQVDPSISNFDEIFQAGSFDVCINCSGAAIVSDSFEHPLKDFHLNAFNVFRLLESIRKHAGNCKFLNLSSAAVYGNPSQMPVAETTGIAPVSPYGWHKYYAEQICAEFSSYFGIKTCSLRIFSAYGPGLKKQIFWDWYIKSKTSTHLRLAGTGNESRDFIYISDLTLAIECVIRSARFVGEVINVANGQQIFIKDAIETFRNLSRNQFSYEFSNNSLQGYPVNWLADTSVLRSLGYQQKVDFDEGLKMYIQWAEGSV